MEATVNVINKYVKPYWKSLMAFVAPGVPLLIAATLEGSPGGSDITSTEIVVALLTMVSTAGAVYAAPKNKPTDGGGE